MKKLYIIILSFILTPSLYAQIGGESIYDFLNLTNSARIGALGGTNISIKDNDINIAYHNPALLQKEMNNALVLNYVSYMTDIDYGYLGYAHYLDKIGTFSLGIHHVNYGDFQRTNEEADLLGIATAAEYAFILTYARQLAPNISMGMSFKPIYSQLDVYKSFGIATDFGFHYNQPEKDLSLAITLRNLGTQITSYNDIEEDFSPDLQMGITKKLAHAPFRFSLTAQYLLDWDLTYTTIDTENATSSDYSDDTESSDFADEFMRHMVIGIEFLPAKNFHIDFGYNHRRRKELGYDEKLSTAGYSWGFGCRIYKFHFSYGSARYHLAGTSNHFSLTTNLSNF